MFPKTGKWVLLWDLLHSADSIHRLPRTVLQLTDLTLEHVHRRRQLCVLGAATNELSYSSLPSLSSSFILPLPSPLHSLPPSPFPPFPFPGVWGRAPSVWGSGGVTPAFFFKFNTRCGALWCSLATNWWLCTSLQFSQVDDNHYNIMNDTDGLRRHRKRLMRSWRRGNVNVAYVDT